MKVLFLGLSFPDSNVTSGNMYTKLLSQFAEHGHEVLAVAPAQDKVRLGIRKEGNLDVLRVSTMQQFKVNNIRKGIANLLLPLQYYRALKKNRIPFEFDLIIIPTPPITLYRLTSVIKRKSGARVYLILRDIFPQNAVDLGFMSKTGLLHRIFRYQEKVLYRISDVIGCMSPANVKFVLDNNPGIQADKVKLLPNWSEIKELDRNLDLETVKRKYGFKDKFVVMFGGNLGKPQGLEHLLELAREMKDIPKILIAIFGDGTERTYLEKAIENSGLSNIVLHPKLSPEDYFQVLQAADVGMISLSPRFTIPNFPSRILAYFGAKKPILAAIDHNTDVGQFLEETGTGLWAHAEDTLRLKDKLLWLYNNPQIGGQMGVKGHTYFKNFLTTEIAYKSIMDQIAE